MKNSTLAYLLAVASASLAIPATAQTTPAPDPGVGGRVDKPTHVSAPTSGPGSHPPFDQNSTQQAIAWNSNPDNIRYFPDVYEFSHTENYASIELVPDPSVPVPTETTKKVFRITASNPGGVDNHIRGEISPKWDYTASGLRWYAMSVYFPAGFVTPTNVDQVFMQLHTTMPAAPPLSVAVRGDRLRLYLRGKPVGQATRHEQWIDLGEFQREKWYCLMVRANWSHQSGSGTMDIHWNTRNIYHGEYLANSYQVTDGLGNYAKAGLYVPKGSNVSALTSQTVYADFIHLGSGENMTNAVMKMTTRCGV